MSLKFADAMNPKTEKKEVLNVGKGKNYRQSEEPENRFRSEKSMMRALNKLANVRMFFMKFLAILNNRMNSEIYFMNV